MNAAEPTPGPPPPTPSCGACRHWQRLPQPPGPATLGRPPLGECRCLPPQVHLLPGPQGMPMQTAAYPQLPATFQACGLFDVGVYVKQAEPETADNG